LLGLEFSGIELSNCDSSSSVLSSSASTGSSEGFSGRAGFNSTETARSGDDSDKDDSDKEDAESDPDCGFNFRTGGVAWISSVAECISVVAAGAECGAVEPAAGTKLGTKLGAGSAKLVSCEETDPAAAACARSSLLAAPGMTGLWTSALAGCAGTLSFV
jgi:hypothetical protein